MNNRLTQIIIGILVSGAVGVGIIYFSDQPAPLPDDGKINDIAKEYVVKANRKNDEKPQPDDQFAPKDDDDDESVHFGTQEEEKPAFDYEKIEALFRSKDPSDREDAFHEIRYAKQTYDIVRLMPFLQQGVNDEDETVREAAVDVIGEYTDDPRILPAVETILQSNYSEQKIEALNHVFNMDYSPQIEQLLISRMWDKDEEVAEQAYDILLQNIDEDFDDIEDAKKFYDSRKAGGL